MAEADDAGEIGNECPCNDDESDWPRGPEYEAGDGKELEPVGALAAAGFGRKQAKGGWIDGLEPCLGDASEPRSGVGEEVFPATNEEDPLVETAIESRRASGFGVEDRSWKAGGAPGDEEVSGGDAEAVEERDPEIGDINPHGGPSI